MMNVAKIISIMLYVLAAFFILVGIGALALPTSPASTYAATYAAIVSFGFAALFIILGFIASRRAPKGPKDLTYIAGKGIFSPWYYIGKEGIYKDRKLFLRWDEIDDIYVLNEYYESRTHLSLRTLQTGIPSTSTTTYVMGTLRVLTKDGRQIDIKNVVNPKEISEYIRKVYLKKP